MNNRTEGRICSAFNRFPMLMVKIIKTLEENNNEMLLRDFVYKLGVPEEWFLDTVSKLIHNSAPLKTLGVFEILEDRPKKLIRLIGKNKEMWEKYYTLTRDQIIKL